MPGSWSYSHGVRRGWRRPVHCSRHNVTGEDRPPLLLPGATTMSACCAWRAAASLKVGELKESNRHIENWISRLSPASLAIKASTFVARNAQFKSSQATNTCGRGSSSAELFCETRTTRCPLVSTDRILALDRAAVNRGRCDRGIVGSAMPRGRHSRRVASRGMRLSCDE